MERHVLAARIRKTKRKGAARKLRKKNEIPAIFYGPLIENVMLAVDYTELERVLKQGIAENIILDLQIQSDRGIETKKVMLKELQVNPVDDGYLHADFYEIAMDREITADIAIRLVNTPVGVANGGVLQHVRRELKVSCLPGKLIDSLEVDVSGMDIGDSLHVGDIVLPEGIAPLDEDHLTVAVVAAPTVIREEAEEEAEVEEEEAKEEENVEES